MIYSPLISPSISAADILNQLPDPCFARNTSGVIILWNVGMEDLTGVLAEEMIGKEGYAYAIPIFGVARPVLLDSFFADPDTLSPYYSLPLSEDNVISAAVNARIRGNSVRIHEQARLLHNDDGTLAGAIEVVRKIGCPDHLLTSDDMRAGHNLFRALLDNSQALITIKDLSGRYILANREFNRLFGIWEGDLYGSRDQDIFSPLDAELITRSDNEVRISGRPITIEESARTTKGVRKYITTRFPIFNESGEMYATGLMSTDITSQKEMEASLRRKNLELIRSYEDLLVAENEIRDIFENIRDLFYRVNENGLLTLSSPSIYTLFGYAPDEMIGKDVLAFWADPLQHDFYVSMLRRDGFVHDFEFLGRRKDGSSVWVSSTVRIIEGPDLKNPRYEGIIRDISERKTHEQERDIALSQIKRNLNELAVLNDGVRNPLTVIMGLASLHNERISEPIKQQVRRIDEMITHIDRRWNESEHVLRYLSRYYGIDSDDSISPPGHKPEPDNGKRA
ncbi:MAG TPA: PAS domain S-box protein [Methanospirillum sp.]|nr:PAS domain S-box protein [Methanospirillum sp.]